ncbi:nuclear transcription factor Y-box subunit beta-like protein [Euroglyphus maynei]|uniref:Nuclear transcription factor Y-box subunit beta-like protein n=1 Tax=Euroglyphus maynei TaxID=6958 RepID=A0A1Y3BIK1_EURMA|nr:nuclear transcription factor Y-box subunit beta-like protein [Euroglyphus maynei]
MYQQPENSNDNSLMADQMGHTTDSYDSGDNDRTESLLREQDRFLPIANISRIMKKSIPANGKIAKEAKECVQECVSEFVSFITSEASDRCKQEKRKTINGDDILFAMSVLGFDNYIEPLQLYLMKYRDFITRTDKDIKSIGNKDDDGDSSSTNQQEDDSIQ